MEENDKWISNLRERMADYAELVPTGLWEELESELGASQKVVPLWHRWPMVAAVALLAVVASVSVWFWQSSPAEFVKQQSAELERALPLPAKPASPALAEAEEEWVAQSVSLPQAEERVAMQPEATTEAVRQTVQMPLDEETGSEPQIEENYPTEQQTLPADVAVKHWGEGRPTALYNKEKKARKWSIGLSTGNGGLPSTVRTDGYLPLPRVENGMYAFATEADFTTRFTQVSVGEGKSAVDYRLPITFGASVRFELDKDWALETGITYTQLSSETTSGDKRHQYVWEEKLHYVGIPLKLHRRLWDNRRFEVYASAGGTVEKCVSGKQTMMQHTTEGDRPAEHDITVKRLQWSLSAAAGVQFKLTEKVGIYAEPGLAYYFDDGSTVNTIRKEHPLNFHVQLGLRFSFPK